MAGFVKNLAGNNIPEINEKEKENIEFARSVGKSDKSEKTRYSDSELEEFRDLILKKIEMAEIEVEENQKQLQEKNSVKFNYLEDAGLMSERELLTTLINRQEKFLQHLKNAIRRIENKTYGFCRETGQLIPKERLMAVPHATLSIEAKRRIDDNN